MTHRHRTPLFAWLPIVLVTTLALAACGKSPEAELKVKIGDRVPELSLRDLKNNRVAFSPASGKITVLNLWATWCGPCREEMPSLENLDNLLDEERFQVVGISVDHDDHVVREFLLERKIFFRNYLDPDADVTMRVIGVRVFPSTLILGPQGEILKIVEGWRYWDDPQWLAEIKSYAVSEPIRTK
jgi:thiol-disulfide isomerase/thioredoxin